MICDADLSATHLELVVRYDKDVSNVLQHYGPMRRPQVVLHLPIAAVGINCVRFGNVQTPNLQFIESLLAPKVSEIRSEHFFSIFS